MANSFVKEVWENIQSNVSVLCSDKWKNIAHVKKHSSFCACSNEKMKVIEQDVVFVQITQH